MTRKLTAATDLGPNDLFMERVALGLILREDYASYEILQWLSPDLFANPDTRAIYTAAVKVWNRDRTIDVAAVYQELRAMGVLSEIGGPDALGTILGIPSLESYRPTTVVRNLDDNRLRRVLTTVYNRRVSENPREEIAEILSTLQAARRNYQPPALSAREAVEQALQELDENAPSQEVVTGLKTFDDNIGFLRGDLVIIGARTSVGKTVIGLTLASGAAKNGGGALIHSLEMAAPRLIKRQLANETEIENWYIQRNKLDDEERAKIKIASERIANLPLWYRNARGMWDQHLAAYEQVIIMNQQINMLVVDYIGLIQGVRADRRDLEIARITSDLKTLALQMNIVVVALAQLNRKTLDQEGKVPQLENFREGGSQEQDADTCILLYAPDAEANRKLGVFGPERLVAMVQKARDGRQGELDLEYDRRYARVVDPPPAPPDIVPDIPTDDSDESVELELL